MPRSAPCALINAAAYTNVDKAETDAECAFLVNRDIPLIHISTDYVFDRTKRTPYSEDDPVSPLGVYGAKLVGEAAGRHLGLVQPS